MLTVAEARARYFAGAGVTLARQTGAETRSEGWLYATARMDTVAVYRAPGANRWLPVTGQETGVHATPLRMLLSLMGAGDSTCALDDKARQTMTDEDTTIQGAGVVLLPVALCGKCGKLLSTPDSVREGFGPECGIRAAARAAKRAAKEAAMAAFNANAASLQR